MVISESLYKVAWFCLLCYGLFDFIFILDVCAEELPPLTTPDSEDEDLASVEVSDSKLVDDGTKSLRFGKSLMIEEALLPWMEKKILSGD